MPSDAPHHPSGGPDPIHAIVTIVSTDPPIACDLLVCQNDDGWLLEGRPQNGDAPFVAQLPPEPGPVLSWMAQVAVLAD
jgi:hypothetical protein